jgi:nitroreductase
MIRRTFLKASGAASIALGGAFVWWAHHEGVFSVGEGPAFEPWQSWRNDEGPLALVRAAILAANPHNTQPWLFKVANARIDIYADTARNLGAFDPYLREMHIGIGCAIENMVIAAAALGYDIQVSVVDGPLDPIRQPPRPMPVATIELSPGAPRQERELYVAIPRRHTNRAAYNPRKAVPVELLRSLQSVTEDSPTMKLMLFSAESERRRFGDMMIAATATIIGDKTMVDDSQRWFRSRWADVQKYRDGPTLDAGGLSPLMAALAKIAPEPSPETNHRYWLAATRDVQVPSAPVLGLIAVESLYDRAQTIRAGRAWQRMHLFATTLGLAMQPINQPIELVDRKRYADPTLQGNGASLTLAPHGARLF